MNFNKVGLKTKIIVGSLSSIIFLSFVGIVLVFNTLGTIKTANSFENSNEITHEIRSLRSMFANMRLNVNEYIISGRKQNFTTYKKIAKQYEQKLIKLNKLLSDNPDQIKLLAVVQEETIRLQKQIVAPLAKLSASPNFDSAKILKQLSGHIHSKGYGVGAQNIEGAIDSLLENQLAVLAVTHDEFYASFNSIFVIGFIGFILAFIGSFITSLILSKSIMNQFKSIFSGLNKFSNEELSILNRDFGEMISNLTTISGTLTSTSKSISTSSEGLSRNVSESASSIEETSASMEEISGMTQNNVQESRKLQDIATSMQDQMAELDNAMIKITESNKDIESLSNIITEIADKTAIIDDIVFQTKLLSFNASVEAERAGEHGRGFAVVAQEVGNLAQMSGKAALEISDIVKNCTARATQISVENKNRVEQGYKIVTQTQKQAKLISDGAVQLYNASNEQFVGIKEVNSALTIINKATMDSSSVSEKNSDSSSQLLSETKRLDQFIAKLLSFLSSNTQKDEFVPSRPDYGRIIETNVKEPYKRESAEVLNLELEKSETVANYDEVKWENL